MVSISTLIITGLLCLLGGAALAAFFLRLWGPPNRTREMEERLYRAEDELKNTSKTSLNILPTPLSW